MPFPDRQPAGTPATDNMANAVERGCFLCAYADTPCGVPSLEGTLLGVAERWRGGQQPVLLIGDARVEPVAVVLQARDRPLARALVALPRDQLRTLRMRIYHLHRALSTPAADQPRRSAYRTLRTSPVSAMVLEPDLLLNITDINHAEYCVRQYVLRRLIPSAPTAMTLRGTIIHGAFKELLKGRADDLETLMAQALRAQSADLALQELPADAVAADAGPHLRALASWYDHQRQQLWSRTPNIRVETFVLAPDVGLKGRLDALWEDDETSRLLELKTSTVRGDLPRREHRWQVYGYQTLLAARRPAVHERLPAATLLYSGTPGQAEAHTLPFTLRELHRVLELRNLLAIVHVTGTVPAPPGATKCARCSMRRECLRASPLLEWEPPPSEEQPAPVAAPDAEWFRHFYAPLAREGRAAEAQGRVLWSTSPAQRSAAGEAISGLEQLGEPRTTASGEWEYTFRCENLSELREGDPILLSDGDPIHGAAVTGTLLSVSDRGVVVWTPERIAHPRLIDRYGSEMVHERTVQNLWRWLDAHERLRALVRGDLAPSFGHEGTATTAAHRSDFNAEQRAAVARALAARDFILIQGPPGTGKTGVVAEIVRQLVARGERVLVAAFTNQAVDNVLRRLVDDGFHDFVRLGHDLSVAPELRSYRLGARAATLDAGDGPGAETSRLRDALLGAPVVASTTATWASERYDGGGLALAFDVAVVDEASQLTVPALLGALRFARRFVLVGDERQLPPLVVSSVAAQGGLAESLFARLLTRWSEAATVRLRWQYRMHPLICEFPSQAFYDGALEPAGAARTALLALGPSTRDGLDQVLDPARPLVFVDVPPGAQSEVGGARISRAQVELAHRVVIGLRARGVPANHIGVIAPYRAQVAAIRQCLVADHEPAVTVDTVDRFQGGEREVIVLALGREPASDGGAFSVLAASHVPFVADPHRLNVALTRAQRKLIVLGDRAALAESPLLERLVAYCSAQYGGHGGVVSSVAVTDPGA
jgi:DNA replication ATP-dependent helicase Dna2